jgi:mevalonate kinase
MNKVTVSAPGKIHLMGEHVVVYGKPALLSAVNKRTFVTIVSAKKNYFYESTSGIKLLTAAKTVVENYFKQEIPFFRMTVLSSIRTGYHLGSSAAVSVAAVGALLYFSKKIWSPDLTNKLAFEVEKVQHGTPSGGDNTIVNYGGFVWFRKELSFLKTVWQVPLRPLSGLSIVLVNTGKPKETTGDMVAFVRKLVEKNPLKVQSIFDENEKATKQVAESIELQDRNGFIDGIKKGEKTLEKLGVVSKQVRTLIRDIETSGGAAKILGGGGRKGAVGYILAVHKERNMITQIASKYAYPVENIVLGEEGVRLEKFT